MNDLRVRVHRHVMSLSASFFDRTPVGRLMTRLTNDIESLTEMFASGIVSLLGDVVRLALILVAMFAIDWRLALFSLGVGAGAVRDRRLFPQLGARRLPGHPGAPRAHERLPAGAPLGHEGRAGVRAGGEGRRATSTSSTSSTGARTRARSRADAALYSIVEAVGSIAVAGLLWHGGGRIAAGTLTFGVVVAFIEYLGKFFAPIRDLSTKYTVMQQAMAAAERVFTLLDTKDPDAPAAAPGRRPAPRSGRGERRSR